MSDSISFQSEKSCAGSRFEFLQVSEQADRSSLSVLCGRCQMVVTSRGPGSHCPFNGRHSSDGETTYWVSTLKGSTASQMCHTGTKPSTFELSGKHLKAKLKQKY